MVEGAPTAAGALPAAGPRGRRVHKRGLKVADEAIALIGKRMRPRGQRGAGRHRLIASLICLARPSASDPKSWLLAC